MTEPREAAYRRILVVANRTCPCPELHATVHERLGAPPASILVVAPALNASRLAHWVSDTDASVSAARERLDLAVEGLAAEGIAVEGVVGDAEPLRAIEDALAGFQADEVILSTHPTGESNWIEDGLLEDARERLDIPVRHFVTEYGLDEVPAAGEQRMPA